MFVRFKINIMGCYALSLGIGTFFLALMGYEVHIRLTICLVNLANKDLGEYLDYNNHKNAEWLLDLHKLSKLLKTAAVILGFLFVLENALIFIANMQQYQKNLPLEFWIIWVFIFLTILFVLPIITLIQIQNLHKIVSQINKKFKDHIYEKYTRSGKLEDPLYLCAFLQNAVLVEKLLKNEFYEKTGEKIIDFSTAILTNVIHILTIYSFWLNI